MTPKREETNIGTHAVLITEDGRVILQKRDRKANITNPGKVSMYGGTLKANETPLKGLYREIYEELMFNFEGLPMFKLGRYKKTKEVDGFDYLTYVYIFKGVSSKELKPSEGEGMIVQKSRKRFS